MREAVLVQETEDVRQVIAGRRVLGMLLSQLFYFSNAIEFQTWFSIIDRAILRAVDLEAAIIPEVKSRSGHLLETQILCKVQVEIKIVMIQIVNGGRRTENTRNR